MIKIAEAQVPRRKITCRRQRCGDVELLVGIGVFISWKMQGGAPSKGQGGAKVTAGMLVARCFTIYGGHGLATQPIFRPHSLDLLDQLSLDT